MGRQPTASDAESGHYLTAGAKRHLILALLVVLPPVVLLGIVMYILHTPHPSVKAPVALTRNSLLPHQYAGPCINCHRIQETTPLSLSRANMDRFNLSETDRQLLLAGQRVEAPRLSQKFSIPAITRSDILPHPYVGVCSNCHLVLNVHPSSMFMRDAMRHAGQHLLEGDLRASDIAQGGITSDSRGAHRRILWGYGAIPLFLLAGVYVVMRLLMRADPDAYRGRFRLSLWLTIHQWAALGFIGAAVTHWYYSDRGNNLLHLAFVSVVALGLMGGVLRYRMAKDGPGQATLLLHTQRFICFALIALVVMGHFFAGFR